MLSKERKMLNEIITLKEDIALDRLNEKEQYLDLCEQQQINEEIATALLQKLEKDDRITVRRFYEGEVRKNGLQLDEVYMYLPINHTISETKIYFKDKLSPDDWKRFEDLMNLCNKRAGIEEVELFEYGFSMGIKYKPCRYHDL